MVVMQILDKYHEEKTFLTKNPSFFTLAMSLIEGIFKITSP
jgi:hypothetical protein